MNGNCKTCDIEAECGYEYKPCDCCNYRKFKPKPEQYVPLPVSPSAQVIQFQAKRKDIP